MTRLIALLVFLVVLFVGMAIAQGQATGAGPGDGARSLTAVTGADGSAEPR